MPLNNVEISTLDLKMTEDVMILVLADLRAISWLSTLLFETIVAMVCKFDNVSMHTIEVSVPGATTPHSTQNPFQWLTFNFEIQTEDMLLLSQKYQWSWTLFRSDLLQILAIGFRKSDMH